MRQASSIAVGGSSNLTKLTIGLGLGVLRGRDHGDEGDEGSLLPVSEAAPLFVCLRMVMKRSVGVVEALFCCC